MPQERAEILTSVYFIRNVMVMGPVLGKSYVSNHSWFEFMNIIVMSLPDDSFSLYFFPSFGSYVLSSSFLMSTETVAAYYHPFDQL